jgi:hypothetical protein
LVEGWREVGVENDPLTPRWQHGRAGPRPLRSRDALAANMQVRVSLGGQTFLKVILMDFRFPYFITYF